MSATASTLDTLDHWIIERICQILINRWDFQTLYNLAHISHHYLQMCQPYCCSTYIESLFSSSSCHDLLELSFQLHDVYLYHLARRQGANLWTYGLRGASYGGHLDLLRILITKGDHFDWDQGLSEASYGGHREVVDYLITVGTQQGHHFDYNVGLLGACYHGDLSMVTRMIEYGANDYPNGMKEAGRGGHREIIMYLEKPLKSVLSGFIGACLGGHLPLIESMLASQPHLVDFGLDFACFGGHLDCVQFLLTHGAHVEHSSFQQTFLGRVCYQSVYVTRSDDHLSGIAQKTQIPRLLSSKGENHLAIAQLLYSQLTLDGTQQQGQQQQQHQPQEQQQATSTTPTSTRGLARECVDVCV